MESRISASTFAALAAAMLAAGANRATAQEPRILQAGEVAPDFALAGATRYGVLRDPVHLSDFRGKTVVVAFFYRVRTPG